LSAWRCGRARGHTRANRRGRMRPTQVFTVAALALMAAEGIAPNCPQSARLVTTVKEPVPLPGSKHHGIYQEARPQAQKEATAWFDAHLQRAAPPAPRERGAAPQGRAEGRENWPRFRGP